MTGRRASIDRTSLALCLVLATLGVHAQAPSRLRELAAQAGITTPLQAWCQGQFRPGQRGFAVATAGRYAVLDGSGTMVDLATFAGTPDLSCYSRAQARALHRDIQRSETLSGSLVPRFDASVVCGFVDATTATCWQYSPADRAYVEVGGWTT